MKSFVVRVPPEHGASGSAFEEFFCQLHKMVGREILALELYATGQNTALCFTALEGPAEVIAAQLYALIPGCDITEVEDYAQAFSAAVAIAVLECGVERDDLYPLADYRSSAHDLLAPLFGVLSRCGPGEAALVQLVVQPVRAGALPVKVRQQLDHVRERLVLPRLLGGEGTSGARERLDSKAAGPLFRGNLRLVCAASTPGVDPTIRVEALCGALGALRERGGNRLVVKRRGRGQEALPFCQDRMLDGGFHLSPRELATLFHIPAEAEAPNLLRVKSRREAPPANLPTGGADGDIASFGVTNFRHQQIPFGIRDEDRRRHLYVVGTSGSGKSKLLELLIRHDLERGRGVGVLDPHGDLVDEVLRLVPRERIRDVVLLDPADVQFPTPFNPLERVPGPFRVRVANGFVAVFRRLFGADWSPRIEHLLRHATLALLDTPGTTFLSLLRMLTDRGFRLAVVRNSNDTVVRHFWTIDYPQWLERFEQEAVIPLMTRVEQLVATNLVRNVLGQAEGLFDFRWIMDERKILLMKFPRGILGEEHASLLGAFAVTRLHQAALSRADRPEEARADFQLYIDEFQHFATEAFAEMVAEARKYRLCLTLAHQHLGQLDERVRQAIFGNVASLVSFRVGAEDATVLARELGSRFTPRDLMNLGQRECCVRMLMNGERQEPFSARTITVTHPPTDFSRECIEYSRLRHARPVAEVEEMLRREEDGWGPVPAIAVGG